MKKMINILVTAFFICMIFTFGILVMITPSKETSYIENRSLALPPPLEKEQFMNGGFMQDFEAFFTDQFPWRDQWLKAYLTIQSTLGKTFLLGYFVSDEDWITTEPDHSFPKEELTEGAQKVNEFHQLLDKKGIDFYYINTPHKVSNMKFLLPYYIDRGAYDSVRTHFLSSLDREMPKLDLLEEFNQAYSENEMKELFFKTDHHWNARGAFEGYRMMIEWLGDHRKGVPARPDKLQLESYDERCLPDKKLVGSFNRQLYLSVDTEEKKCAYYPEDKAYDQFIVEKDGEVVDEEYIYGRAFNQKEEEVYYSTLHTKDYRELKITNPDLEDEGERVLIIKDSYANALSFLLAQQFYETTYYDQRHNRDRALMDYIDQQEFDLVIMMYNDPTSDGAIYEYEEPLEES